MMLLVAKLQWAVFQNHNNKWEMVIKRKKEKKTNTRQKFKTLNKITKDFINFNIKIFFSKKNIMQF